MQSIVPVYSAALPNHMLVDRQRPIHSIGVCLAAFRIRPIQQAQERGLVPATHLKVHPPAPVALFHHRCPHPQVIAFCSFLTPKYVHISSSAIVDAAIVAARPRVRPSLGIQLEPQCRCLTSCLYDRSRAKYRILNSNLDSTIPYNTEECEHQE